MSLNLLTQIRDESPIDSEDRIRDILTSAPNHHRYFYAAFVIKHIPEHAELAKEITSPYLEDDLKKNNALLTLCANTYTATITKKSNVETWRTNFDKNGAILIQDGSTFWFIHPSAQKPGHLQATYYNKRCGGPSGDCQFKDFESIFDIMSSASISARAKEIPFHIAHKVMDKLNGPLVVDTEEFNVKIP